VHEATVGAFAVGEVRERFSAFQPLELMTVIVDGRHPTKILLDPFVAFDAPLVAGGVRIERL
jgi:hypothetical protein